MQDPRAVHAAALVIDTHADTPQRLLDDLDDPTDPASPPWDFVSSPLGLGHLNLAAARAGNLAAQFFALWVDPAEYPPPHHAHRTVQLLDAVLGQVRSHPAELRLCLTPADILEAKRDGRFAILLGLEGGQSIENSLAHLRIFHALGVRYMTLTWSHTTDWADSSGDHLESGEPADQAIPHHNGLSPFGHTVIREMNRLGMMIDVSHVSDKTLADVLTLSTAPVIASHSSARVLTHAPRNLTDDQLRAIAASGGVIMVNFFPAFIDESWRLAWNAQKPERDAAHSLVAAPYRAVGRPVPGPVSAAVDRRFTALIPRPPLASLIAHFLHILDVVGPNHIGIGSDFDGIPDTPQDMLTAADLPCITESLMAHGVPAETMHKLLGQNLLRVMTQIQAQADPTSAPL